jgi:signal transduction histidine kinase
VRRHDYEREARALRAVSRDLLSDPQELSSRIAQVACDLTGAPSAGISLITEAPSGEKHFSWVAMGGRYAKYLGGSTPLNHSPCGFTLYQDSAQLFACPGRFYESLTGADPELVEGLVVPIKGAHDLRLGTIWVASHGAGPEFDLEDARILGSLGDLFGAALELRRSRDAALQRAERMAQSAMDVAAASDRKSNSMATVAHELRNPLQPIITSVRALKLSNCSEPQSKLIGIIERQSERLSTLINQMLDVAKIERGDVTLDLQLVDVKNIISDAVESVGEQFRRKAQRFELFLPVGELTLRADAVMLSQALTNLLQNASKYTPDGGRITLEASQDGAELTVSVSDSGIGIPREAIGSLFSLYSRASNAGGEPGLGIGLWLVRYIVELHSGAVHVHSDGVGKGARFTLTLPRLTSPALSVCINRN